MKTSFFTEDELRDQGFKSYGKNVLISRKASLYDKDKMVFGNNVRVDDFCLLSGEIKIGSFVHISAYSALYGTHGIEINDFSGVSPRCIIFSALDDFSGNHLIGPMIPEDFARVSIGKVVLKKYVQVGAGSLVFPDLIIGEGSVIGALSLVKKSLNEWRVYAGIPVRDIGERSKNLLNYVNEMKKKCKTNPRYCWN